MVTGLDKFKEHFAPFADNYGGNCKTPIWGQIRAFCAGSGF